MRTPSRFWLHNGAVVLAFACGGVRSVPSPVQSAVNIEAHQDAEVVHIGGKTVLVYELMVTNNSNREIQLTRFQATEASGQFREEHRHGELHTLVFGSSTATINPEQDMGAWVRIHGAELEVADGRVAPGRRVVVAAWTEGAHDAAIPGTLTFEVDYTDGTRTQTHRAELPVKNAVPISIGPPLRGRVVAMNGLGPTKMHRWTGLPFASGERFAQRFAVDFTSIGDDGCVLPRGADVSVNTNYLGYDRDVLAVADASVARVLDGLPENVPGDGSRALVITPTTVTGNAVWLDLGDHHYAFYAHLRPGSIRVREGERVHRGDVVGKLGNSGNSTNPHLHFHIANTTAGLDGEGLPYAIDTFAATTARIPEGADWICPELTGPSISRVLESPEGDTVIDFR